MRQKLAYLKLRIVCEIRTFFLRNKIQLCYPNLPAKKDRVNLNYYHAGFLPGVYQAEDTGERNLGDDLAVPIFSYMLQRKGLTPDSTAKKRTHLYSIGSILMLGYQDAVVWGSGILTETSFLRTIFHRAFFRKLDIRAVRGPLTRKTLLKWGHHCPEVCGDPGCLMPLFYKPSVEKTLDYLVIPHYLIERKVKNTIPAENITSMMTDDYQAVIDKICSAKKVISSSLHGIILAEAYGVPAIHFQHRPKRFDFKYEDWYQSTGRNFGPAATTLEEAIAMDPGVAPDLTRMQQQLLDAFPYDLWDAPTHHEN